METTPSEKFIKAKNRVDRIKDFYGHTAVYVVANVCLLIFNAYTSHYLEVEGIANEDLSNWLTANIILTPLLWGIALAIHGILAFGPVRFPWKNLKPGFIKKWEERQIRKFMKSDAEQDRKWGQLPNNDL